MGVPYSALDQGIAGALRGQVQEVRECSAFGNVAEEAAAWKPDLLFVLNGFNLPLGQLDEIRRGGTATAVWFVDDPYFTDWTAGLAPHYDYIFTQERNCVELYQSLGCRNVHFLSVPADPSVYYPRKPDIAYLSDVCFIGTAFGNRLAFIDQVARYLSTKNLVLSGWWWNRLKNYKLLKSKIRKDKLKRGSWLSPEETSSYYNGAKIVINLHRAAVEKEQTFNLRGIPALSVNPRTFEIAGTGAFQLSDIREDLPQYYRDGQEIATYSTPQELAEKIEYYLTHEEERRRAALNGFRRTIMEHTYPDRIRTILERITRS
ncbi:glycosyltransferase [Paenibacillus sp. CC-CFT747]|nr:glycosyltransferase [Paenibacillus sp. CC-CFT747]